MRTIDHEVISAGAPKNDCGNEVTIQERLNKVLYLRRRPVRGLALEIRLPQSTVEKRVRGKIGNPNRGGPCRISSCLIGDFKIFARYKRIEIYYIGRHPNPNYSTTPERNCSTIDNRGIVGRPFYILWCRHPGPSCRPPHCPPVSESVYTARVDHLHALC